MIAGHTGAVERAAELAKAAGARRAVMLPVSAPFHCALMKPAQERLKADLDATEFRDLAVPLINNWQAREIRDRSRRPRRAVSPSAESGAVGRFHARAGRRRRHAVHRSGRGRRAHRAAAQYRPGLAGFKFGEAADWEKLAGA